MGSAIFSLFIFICFLWIILRSGRRHAKYAMRRLAQQTNGIFIDGGLFSQSYVITHRGSLRLHNYIRPRAIFGGHYQLVLSGPWPNRAAIPLINPQHYVNSSGNAKISDRQSDLAGIITKLKSFPHKQMRISADTKGFEFLIEVDKLGPNTATHWYEIGARMYDVMLADTEPGLEFLSVGQNVDAFAATCQVCGTHPEPRETVVCDRCGAPHHAECWEYNGGCAIFGCRTPAKR